MIRRSRAKAAWWGVALAALSTLGCPPPEGGSDELLQIRLPNRHFAPDPKDSELASLLSDTQQGPQELIVQLERPPSDADRARLAAAGIRLLSGAGEQAYLAELRPVAGAVEAQAQRELEELVRWAGRRDPREKMVPSLLRFLAEPPTTPEPPGGVDVVVLFGEDVTTDEARSIIAKHGGTPPEVEFVIGLRTRIDVASLPTLARERSVRWIEEYASPSAIRIPPPPKLR